MTDTAPEIAMPSHLAHINVTSNATEAKESAPVEQQSTETAPEAPLPEATPEIKAEIPAENQVVGETPAETATLTTSAPEVKTDDKENERAKELIAAKLEADNLRRELSALKPAPKPIGEKPVMGAIPKLEDFTTLEAWQAAVKETQDKFVTEFTEWNERKLEDEANKRISAREASQRAEAEKLAVATKDAAARAKHADYDAVINPIIPLVGAIPILKNFLAQEPLGAEVVYELGKNPAVLNSLLNMNTWEAGKTLLAMADRLSKAPVVAQTKAPAPIKPINSPSATSAPPSLIDLASKGSLDGYFAARNKQVLKEKGMTH